MFAKVVLTHPIEWIPGLGYRSLSPSTPDVCFRLCAVLLGNYCIQAMAAGLVWTTKARKIVSFGISTATVVPSSPPGATRNPTTSTEFVTRKTACRCRCPTRSGTTSCATHRWVMFAKGKVSWRRSAVRINHSFRARIDRPLTRDRTRGGAGGKKRTHCFGNIVDVIMYSKRRLVLPRAQHLWQTRLFCVLDTTKCLWKSCAIMCPRFAGALELTQSYSKT